MEGAFSARGKGRPGPHAVQKHGLWPPAPRPCVRELVGEKGGPAKQSTGQLDEIPTGQSWAWGRGLSS